MSVPLPMESYDVESSSDDSGDDNNVQQGTATEDIPTGMKSPSLKPSPVDSGDAVETLLKRPSPSTCHVSEVHAFSQYIGYWFVQPIVSFAHKSSRPMEADDMWRLADKDRVEDLIQAFDAYRREHPGSFYGALFSLARIRFLSGAFFLLLKSTSEVCLPLLSREVLTSIQNQKFDGLYYSLGFVALLFFGQTCNQLHMRNMELGANRLRAVCNYAIYRQAMQMRACEAAAGGGDKSQTQKPSTDITSLVVTLVASDSQRLIDCAPFIHLLWSSPFQIALGTYFMVLFLGYSSLAAIGLMLALYPTSYVLSLRQSAIRRVLLPQTEQRVRQIAEFLQGVKVVKMFAWEMPLRESVLVTRTKEMACLMQELLLWVVFCTMTIVAPQVAIMITFTIYVYRVGYLTASDAFAALSMLSILKFPVLYFGNASMMVSQARVGCERIRDFLNQQPLVDSPTQQGVTSLKQKPIATQMESNRGIITTNPLPTERDPSMDEGVKVLEDEDADEEVAAEPSQEMMSEEAVVAIQRATICWMASHKKEETSAPAEDDYDEGEDAVDKDRESPAEANQKQQHRRLPPPTSQTEPFAEPPGGDQTTSATTTLGNEIGQASVAPTSTTTRETFIFSLRDVSLNMKRGDVFAVVGKVGSGKSLLCHALLREASLTPTAQRDGHPPSFQSHLPDEVAYAAQEPFLLSGTVRDNILFFRPFDETTYRKVLTACELWPDFEVYPDGERTMVGERGVTLSGGQKARIALARAVYASILPPHVTTSSGDVVTSPPLTILDDPFSALDARTGAAIVEALLHPHMGLLRKQAVLMVTHARQFLSVAQWVVELRDGTARVTSADCIDEACFLSPTAEDDDAAEEEEEASRREEACISQGRDALSPRVKKDTKKKENVLSEKTTDALVTQENTSATVQARTYWDYFRMGGGWIYMIAVMLTLAIERIIFAGCDVWVSVWTSANAGPPTQAIGKRYDLPAGNTFDGAVFYLRVYATLVCLVVAMCIIRLAIFGFGGWLGTHRMFLDAFQQLTRCPMAYFDATPTGRILNRFSHDVERVGYPLITQMNNMIASLGWMFTGLIATAVIAPISLAVSIPCIIGVMYYVYLYRPVNVHVQRLDAALRSHLQGCLFESVHGAITVRALGRTDAFMSHFAELIDQNSRVLVGVCLVQRWVSMRAEALGACMAGFICLLMWLQRSTLSTGLAGMAIVWGLNMSRSVSFTITDGVQGQAKLVSVERLLEFVAELPNEPPRCLPQDPTLLEGAVEDKRKLSTMREEVSEAAATTLCEAGHHTTAKVHFPAQGSIVFENVHMRYRSTLPLVLSGCSFKIQARERIGVVGRTGSGKSSLIIALYRLRELEQGRILIDGHDISQLGLDCLRGSRMAIIPQDPILFAGTIRSNVDPYGYCDDTEITDALQAATLWQDVLRAGGLEATVEDRGRNWSVGQRQLVCVARALLRRPTVLLMDEATANVDHDTDIIIQHTVKTLFRGVTVVEVAHRLHSVMGTDRVIVMHAGSVVEFDSPAALLTQTTKYSVFRSMVDATGERTARELREMAFCGKP